MKAFGHRVALLDGNGEVRELRPRPARRVTVEELGPRFGSDRYHKLVVSLDAGDTITFRPHKTRRVVTARAVDLYAYVLECESRKARASREVTPRRRRRSVRLFTS